MERHEAENLSAVLWEREPAAKEKLEAGYDPVVMIRVVEWSGICWAYDRLSKSEGASDPRHELMGWMLVQDALRDDESVRWRVHQDALGLIMNSFGMPDWHRSDRTVPYDWPDKDVLAERYAACRNVAIPSRHVHPRCAGQGVWGGMPMLNVRTAICGVR